MMERFETLLFTLAAPGSFGSPENCHEIVGTKTQRMVDNLDQVREFFEQEKRA